MLKRNVNGILLFNKPIDVSSNAALQRVKRLFQARKAGHTGSLDKLASGLLPICLGEATKISNFLLMADKYYETTLTLGATTLTGDSEGEILQTRPTDNITHEQIEKAVQSFLGSSEQIPPMYSALKHQGQPLYKLARQGKTIERKARIITIYDIEIQSLIDNYLSIKVHCSKGTYIRTLAEDIGEALGCGAFVSRLHRIGVGNYWDMVDYATLEQQTSMEELDKLLIPMQTAISHWPKVDLSTELAYYIKQGQAVQTSQAPADGWVQLFSGELFLGIGQVLEDGKVTPKRLINYN
ncbi:tRNA pseudouridine(55) synthase TruB [Candidatus Halobeggiatoa sp. HSG11]|nr:tRNA pseudouridine(55) synthase TruB [Candidatus Halobeggiatoa sp. HSG11]